MREHRRRRRPRSRLPSDLDAPPAGAVASRRASSPREPRVRPPPSSSFVFWFARSCAVAKAGRDRTSRASDTRLRSCDARPERPRRRRRPVFSDRRRRAPTLSPARAAPPHAPFNQSSPFFSPSRRLPSPRRRAASRRRLLLVRARLRSTHLARRLARRVRRLSASTARRTGASPSSGSRRPTAARPPRAARRSRGRRARRAGRRDGDDIAFTSSHRHERRRPAAAPGRAGRSCGSVAAPAGRRKRVTSIMNGVSNCASSPNGKIAPRV